MTEHSPSEHDQLIGLYGLCTVCAVPHARQVLARQDARIVTGKATDAWKAKARRAILDCAAECDPREGFTTDDVWLRVTPVDEPRVMGGLMREAEQSGRIVRTDTTRPSKHPLNHSRPVRVWVPAAGRLI